MSIQFEAGGQPVSGAGGPITEPILPGLPDLGQNTFYEYGAARACPASWTCWTSTRSRWPPSGPCRRGRRQPCSSLGTAANVTAVPATPSQRRPQRQVQAAQRLLGDQTGQLRQGTAYPAEHGHRWPQRGPNAGQDGADSGIARTATMASAEVPSIHQTRRAGTGGYCTSAPVPSVSAARPCSGLSW
jgi:hypothetical protein